MSFTSYQELTNGSYLYLQHLNTSSEELLTEVELEDDERAKVEGFKLEVRKRQFLEARRIVQQKHGIKERIVYTPTGKPALEYSRNAISLSHSGDYLAVLMDPSREVGIDLQRYTEKMTKIVNRFIHEDELQYIVEEDKMHYYHILWCAKEALFKWVEEQGIHFKENLRVNPFVYSHEGKLKASIKLKDKQYAVELAFQKLENYYLVYTFNR